MKYALVMLLTLSSTMALGLTKLRIIDTLKQYTIRGTHGNTRTVQAYCFGGRPYWVQAPQRNYTVGAANNYQPDGNSGLMAPLQPTGVMSNAGNFQAGRYTHDYDQVCFSEAYDAASVDELINTKLDQYLRSMESKMVEQYKQLVADEKFREMLKKPVSEMVNESLKAKGL